MLKLNNIQSEQFGFKFFQVKNLFSISNTEDIQPYRELKSILRELGVKCNIFITYHYVGKNYPSCSINHLQIYEDKDAKLFEKAIGQKDITKESLAKAFTNETLNVEERHVLCE